MSEIHKDTYAASVNPPRRAKRSVPPSVAQEGPQQPSTSGCSRPIMPAKPYTPRASVTGPEPSEPPPPPAKRGRKPGPLSRTAREAQRRLNHSIIEKARRTKINDALAALKQLVPVNYGQQQKQATDSAAGSREQRNEDEDDDDSNDEDADYEEGGSAKKSKPSASTSAVKPKGKKEEKEKEFKLEILIRTVSFLEDLLKRVATLEAAAATTPSTSSSAPLPQAAAQDSQTPPCPICGAKLDKTRRQHLSKKRKRVPSLSDDDGYSTDNDNDERETPQGNTTAPSLRRAKVARHSQNPSKHAPVSPPPTVSPSFSTAALAAPVPVFGSATPKLQSPVERLPSISSWLHPMEPVIDPQLLSTSCGGADNTLNAGAGSNSYLPSPPASTHFPPVRGTHGQPPVLNLGPVATAAMVSNGTANRSGSPKATTSNARASSKARTPEDESAASLLLQIATSPQFRAVRSSSFSSASSTPSVPAAPPGSMAAPDGTNASRRSPTSPATHASRSRANSVNGGWALPDPSNFMLHSSARAREREREQDREWGTEKGMAQQVQTPSSLLGLNLGIGRRY